MVRKAKKAQFVKEFHEIDKETFKICEAVALGLTHYYLDDQHDRHEITDADIVKAGIIIPTLPKGWMQQKHSWDDCRK